MSRRIYTWNAYESSLNGAINTTAVDLTLNSVTNLRGPGLLVIDPDIPAKREFIRFETINASVIESCTRNIDGGGLSAHDDGAVVRAVPMHQFYDDLFSDIEDIESAAAAHTGAANPHSGSAGTAALAATDANVAANTAGIATNVTNIGTNASGISSNTALISSSITTHENDTAGHPAATGADPGFMVAADKTKLDTYPAVGSADIEVMYLVRDYVFDASFSTAATYAAIAELLAVTVPTAWTTYDVTLAAGGVVDVSPGAIGDGVDLKLTSDIPGETILGLVQESIGVGVDGRVGWAVKGTTSATVTRATTPSFDCAIEGRDTGSGSPLVFRDTWFEMEIRRRS
jgi:hypothetical protein